MSTVHQGGKPPPSFLGHGVGEDAAGVGLDHLGDEGLVGNGHPAALVVILHFNLGEGDRLPVAADDPAERVAGPQPVRPHQGLDLHREAHQLVPALLGAHEVHHHLGVVDDHLPLGRLPVGRRLDVKHVVARPDQPGRGRVGRFAVDLPGHQRAEQVVLLAADHHPELPRHGHLHGRAVFHGMRKDDLQLDRARIACENRIAGREEDLEMGLGPAGRKAHHQRGDYPGDDGSVHASCSFSCWFRLMAGAGPTDEHRT
jgi:hypothetical protein